VSDLEKTTESSGTNEPKTYWEKRSCMAESALEAMILELRPILPDYIIQNMSSINRAWWDAVDELDKEFDKEGDV